MKTLNLHSICAVLVLVFGVQSTFAEKLIVPKQDDKKKVQSQSGGGDTGGGGLLQINNTRAVIANSEIRDYLQKAEYYLPFVMRYIDYYMNTQKRQDPIIFPESKSLMQYSNKEYEIYIGQYNLFSSDRDHSSVYEVLKHVRFDLRDECFNKNGESVAASVYNEKVNDVCISRSKILDEESKLNTGNILVSLVGLMAHEVLHKAGVNDEKFGEYGPNWVQAVILAHFRPVQKNGQAGYTAWNILRTIERRKDKFETMLAKAKKSQASACYDFGFNLVEEVRSIDAEMNHALEQGISYLSFESYKDWLTALHIMIYASSFCLDNDDMKALLFPMNTDEDKKAYQVFFWTNQGEKFIPYARREPLTLHSRAIPTTAVGRGDILSLEKVLQQAEGLLKPAQIELRDLLQKIDGGGK